MLSVKLSARWVGRWVKRVKVNTKQGRIGKKGGAGRSGGGKKLMGQGCDVVQIGNKLDYVFGKAIGPAHNVERARGMLKQLQSVGIYDNVAGRSLLQSYLKNVHNNTKGIIQTNGRCLRESILIGPNGALKVESVWEGGKLITVKFFGGK